MKTTFFFILNRQENQMKATFFFMFHQWNGLFSNLEQRKQSEEEECCSNFERREGAELHGQVNIVDCENDWYSLLQKNVYTRAI